MLEHLITSLNIVFGREGKVIHKGYAIRCNTEQSVEAHEILSSPGLQVYHSIEKIGGVEYDFVATLRPRTKS